MLKEYLVRTFPKIKFTFIYQDKQNGLGDAVSCGKK
jgi:UTP-glucose-1-phosphate uridylyltransferase